MCVSGKGRGQTSLRHVLRQRTSLVSVSVSVVAAVAVAVAVVAGAVVIVVATQAGSSK